MYPTYSQPQPQAPYQQNQPNYGQRRQSLPAIREENPSLSGRRSLPQAALRPNVASAGVTIGGGGGQGGDLSMQQYRPGNGTTNVNVTVNVTVLITSVFLFEVPKMLDVAPSEKRAHVHAPVVEREPVTDHEQCELPRRQSRTDAVERPEERNLHVDGDATLTTGRGDGEE